MTPAPHPSPRTAVITGAASGIGRATAEELAARGFALVLWDVAAEPLAAVAEATGAARHAVVDITDPDAVAYAAADAGAVLDGIDVLVHSAGVLHVGTFADVPLPEHRRTVDINLWGTICVVHQLLPALRERRGAVLLMGSASAFYGPPEFASYGATKAGVLSLAQALNTELQDDGVVVATCNPLFVAGPMVDGQRTTAHFVRSEGLAHTPEQVARAIARWADRPRAGIVWPSFAPRRIWLLSRYAAFAAPAMMARAFRKARSKASRAGVS